MKDIRESFPGLTSQEAETIAKWQARTSTMTGTAGADEAVGNMLWAGCRVVEQQLSTLRAAEESFLRAQVSALNSCRKLVTAYELVNSHSLRSMRHWRNAAASGVLSVEDALEYTLRPLHHISAHVVQPLEAERKRMNDTLQPPAAELHRIRAVLEATKPTGDVSLERLLLRVAGVVRSLLAHVQDASVQCQTSCGSALEALRQAEAVLKGLQADEKVKSMRGQQQENTSAVASIIVDAAQRTEGALTLAESRVRLLGEVLSKQHRLSSQHCSDLAAVQRDLCARPQDSSRPVALKAAEPVASQAATGLCGLCVSSWDADAQETSNPPPSHFAQLQFLSAVPEAGRLPGGDTSFENLGELVDPVRSLVQESVWGGRSEYSLPSSAKAQTVRIAAAARPSRQSENLRSTSTCSTALGTTARGDEGSLCLKKEKVVEDVKIKRITPLASGYGSSQRGDDTRQEREAMKRELHELVRQQQLMLEAIESANAQEAKGHHDKSSAGLMTCLGFRSQEKDDVSWM